MKNCDYCKQNAPLVDSSIVYGRSYGPIYYCEPCKAWVGVHKGTTRPLGRLANAELREWKKKAHAAFDPLWKNGLMKRTTAYKLLAESLGLKEVHIGESDVEMCKKIIEAAENLIAQAVYDEDPDFPEERFLIR